MDESDPASLREEARRCRRIAGSISNEDVIKTLEGLAREYEAKARGIKELRRRPR